MQSLAPCTVLSIALAGPTLLAQAPVYPSDFLEPTTPSLAYGSAVAVTQTLAVVGDPLDESVDVWKFVSGAWTHHVTIQSSNAAFGTDVDTRQELIIAGAPEGDASGGGTNEAGWIELHAITLAGSQPIQLVESPTPTVGGHFGAAVALGALPSGQRYAVVGEPGGNRAHIYEENASSVWQRVQQVDAPSGATGFGHDLAASSGLVAIASTGRVHVLEHDGTDWSGSLVELTHASTTPEFGAAIATESEVVAVGDTAGNGGRGSGHLFEKVGGAWSHVAELKDDSVQVGGKLGRAAGIDGDDVVIFGGEKSFTGRGFVAVYVFCEAAGEYQLQQVMLPGNTQDDDTGFAVAVDPGVLIAGAPKESRVNVYDPAVPSQAWYSQGSNPNIYSATDVVLGKTWTGTVDVSSLCPSPCSQFTVSLYGCLGPASFALAGTPYYVLVDLAQVDWSFLGVTPVNGVATFSAPIECQSALLGVEYFTQAFAITSAPQLVVPTNAITLRVGY